MTVTTIDALVHVAAPPKAAGALGNRDAAREQEQQLVQASRLLPILRIRR